MNRLIVVVALATAVYISNGKTSEAALIFSTYNASSSGSQIVDSGSSNGWWAQAFSTTASLAEITEVKLNMSNADPNSTFTVQIFNSSGSVPTSSVATIYSGTPGQFFAPFTISGLSVQLAPSTQYFVAVAPTVGEVSWAYTSLSLLNAQSINQGTSWNSSSIQPFRMDVSAVPEPSSIALVTVALGAFGVTASRRLRRRRVDAAAGAITA